jgi:hypothetical protein
MYRRCLITVLSLMIFLAGCQLPGGKPSGAKEGYFTWVDEQGQVRQTLIPVDGSPDENEDWAETPHSEFNLQNYPDGDSLAAQGHIRPGDPEPYFTWRDARGNVRVSYYRPDTRTAVEKGDIKPPLELTEASIYQAGDKSADREPGSEDLPQGADAMAAAVLGLDERDAPFFVRWAEACCDTLDRSAYIDWEPGREFGVTLEESSPAFDFITGNSHYRLVRLPETKDFILRLRSFDQRGLFVPSVAFLDSEFRPLRLVTDLVAEFVPESWRQHGYLRSYIPVFPSREERWLLIYTTSEDIEGQTVIDTRYGPRAIAHQPTGQIGLVRVEN